MGSVAEDGWKKKTNQIVEFFENPLVQFLSAIMLSLVVVLSTERNTQILGIIAIAVFFMVLAAVRIVLGGRTSLASLREENETLKLEIPRLNQQIDNLKQQLQEYENFVPQIIEHKSIIKNIKILDAEGNARLQAIYEAQNISGRPLEFICHGLQTSRKTSKKSISGVFVNDESAAYRVKIMKSGESYKTEVTITPKIAIPNNQPAKNVYQVLMKKEYLKAFTPGEKASSMHSIFSKTDKLVTNIEAPNGYVFSSPLEVDVRDIYNNSEVPEEKLKVKTTCRPIICAGKQLVNWEIKLPRMSYKYIIYFSLELKK